MSDRDEEKDSMKQQSGTQRMKGEIPILNLVDISELILEEIIVRVWFGQPLEVTLATKPGPSPTNILVTKGNRFP